MFNPEELVYRFRSVLRFGAARERAVAEYWVPHVPWTAGRWATGKPAEGADLR
jgi:hypothetical protein